MSAKIPHEAREASNLQTALVNTFKKLHQEQLEVFEETLSSLKDTCVEEIQETLATHVKKQLENNFQNVVEACQLNISHLVAPLVRKAEEDVKRLENEVARTNALCQEIQRKYAFRWDKPFLILMLSTSLSGAFVALALLLMQTSPLAVFLMDARARKAYDHGLHWLKWKDAYEAQKAAEAVKVQDSPKPEKKGKRRKRS